MSAKVERIIEEIETLSEDEWDKLVGYLERREELGSVVRNRLRKEPERENLYGGLSVVPRTQGVVLRASG